MSEFFLKAMSLEAFGMMMEELKGRGLMDIEKNTLNTSYWRMMFGLQTGKVSLCIRSSGKMPKRKSLGPEISNNRCLYPLPLLVRLQDLRDLGQLQ